MVSRKARRKARQARDKARSSVPRVGQEVPPAEEAPGDPPPESPTGPRPYRISLAQSPGEALQFTQWLAARTGPEHRLGFACSPDGYIGIADQEEGWQLSGGHLLDEVTQGALEQAFSGNQHPALVVRSVSSTAQRTIGLPGRLWLNLHQAIDGENEALLYSTGRALPNAVLPLPVDVAYDALAVDAQWRDSAPPFYRKVAFPRALQRAQETEEGEGTPWRISYSDLFLRVVAHITRDPVLTAGYRDGVDPLPEVAERLELTEEEALATIYWTVLGYDAVYLSETHPQMFNTLPQGLDKLMGTVDRTLPQLRMAAGSAGDDYVRLRGMKTLYGRQLMWGASVAQALDHLFRGSTQDLIDVAYACFAEESGVTLAPAPEEVVGRDVLRVRGWTTKPRETWYPVLEQLAPLGNPLSVPLGATVLWDP